MAAMKVLLVFVGLLILIQTPSVIAGDEDINPNAYQQFDPETGYMMPVDPQSTQHQKNNSHNIDSTPQRAVSTQPTDGQTSNYSDPMLWLKSGITLSVLGGLVLLVKKYRQ